MPELKRFGIYHPKEGVINDSLDFENVVYEYAASVEAENVVRSFYMAQISNPKYKELGKRNTAIGDIITHNTKVFMVNGKGGFKRVFPSKDLYRKIMDTDEAIIEILSRQHLTQEDIDDLIENSY